MAINSLSDLSESDLEWLSGKMRYEARQELDAQLQQATHGLEQAQQAAKRLQDELSDLRLAYAALAQLLAGRGLVAPDVLATTLSRLARAREDAGYGDGLQTLVLLLQGYELPASARRPPRGG